MIHLSHYILVPSNNTHLVYSAKSLFPVVKGRIVESVISESFELFSTLPPTEFSDYLVNFKPSPLDVPGDKYLLIPHRGFNPKADIIFLTGVVRRFEFCKNLSEEYQPLDLNLDYFPL